MSNIASSFRSRSSSTASQEPQEGEELRVSISSLRSRFESLAAGSGVSGVGDGGIRKSASTAGRPDGQAAGKAIRPTQSSRSLTPELSQPMSNFLHSHDSPRPLTTRSSPENTPMILSSPASFALAPGASSVPHPDVMSTYPRAASSAVGALSTSPTLAASPAFLSARPWRRPPPAIRPLVHSQASTPTGSDDGSDLGLQPSSASVKALRERFSASPSLMAETSTAPKKSDASSKALPVSDRAERFTSIAALSRDQETYMERTLSGGSKPLNDLQTLQIPRSRSPGVIEERINAKKPAPPPPLSRSVSPGLSRPNDANNPVISAQMRPSADQAGRVSLTELHHGEDKLSAPPLPPRTPASAEANQASPPPSNSSPKNKPLASFVTPMARSPSTEFASGPPRLPERPRARTIGKADESRHANAAPRLPSRTGMAAMPGTDCTLPPPPSHHSSSAMSPQRSRELSNDNHQLPPMRSTTSGVVSSPPQREDSKTGGLTSDDEDEGEEVPLAGMTAATKRMYEDFPDSTHVRRRPPEFVPVVRISSIQHVNSFAVFGRYVCTGAHHVRVYDTQMSDRPIFTVDMQDVGLEFRIKEPRVTAMCFRPVADPADEGRYLWCGTKDGHLWELDIRTGTVTDRRAFVHAAVVTNIFRHQQQVLTLDESGKLHVFEVVRTVGSATPKDARTISNLIRSFRITEKFTFAKMICGKLWISSAPSNRSTTNTSSRGPTIRVYEPCVGDPMPVGRSISTSEWTGAVTSATIMPLQADIVYIGHEGGFVSTWSVRDLTCLQVLKISSTDILALEGVGERLWAGNRKGQIHVYDPSEKPWRTTKVWTAHPDLPIHSLLLDPWSIEHAGRFVLWSAARDTIRAWDGLLSVDWIDNEMTQRQADYCTFRDINILVCSWNLDSAKPSDLVGTEANVLLLEELLGSVESPDIVVFGFQEVIPLTDKKLTAKTLLFGGKHKETGTTADKVSHAYRQWLDKLQNAVRMAMPANEPYVKIHSESLVGLFTCIFVKTAQKTALRDLDICTVKRGMGGIYGNKGAIVARMVIDDTSICFINVHLASGQSQKLSRNTDLAAIMEDKAILPASDETPFVHGGDGTAVRDHEMVILNGDLNYRIDQRRESVLSSIAAGDLSYLLEHDQLRKEMRDNNAFRLRSFEEAPIVFNPTYKYNAGSEEYDSSEKRRIPAWCDRILFTRSPRVHSLNYKRYEATISDHRPISAGLRVTIKAVDGSKMAAARSELSTEWAKRETEILGVMAEAYGRLI